MTCVHCPAQGPERGRVSVAMVAMARVHREIVHRTESPTGAGDEHCRARPGVTSRCGVQVRLSVSSLPGSLPKLSTLVRVTR